MSAPLEERLVAPAGSPLADIYAIALRHGLDPDFPAEVEREVSAWLAAPGIDAPELEDLSAYPFVTIDDASSLDLDQALFIRREGEGSHRVYYALADASYYCPAGSALFEESLARGASYYLPGFMVPMLPRALSEGLVSLNPGVERRALVVEMQLDGGVLVGDRIYRARVKSEAKLSFEGVQAFYDGRGEAGCSEAAAESLRQLRSLGELLIQGRKRRGAIRYRRCEVDVKLSGGHMGRFVATGGVRDRVERYNEEISLLCNTVGARFLRDGDTADDGVEPIYRIHAAPNDERVEDFVGLLGGLVRLHAMQAETWAWSHESKEDLASYLRRLPKDGRQGRWAQAIHRQAVMLNHRSVFSDVPAGHFGVGADIYARFSSPMREVVGVFVHKEALERLAGGAPETRGNDEALRERVMEKANQAKWLQKQLNKEANAVVIDDMCRADLENAAPPRRGTVMGLTPSKIHVQLDEPPMDLKVYVSSLGTSIDQRLRVDRGRLKLTGEGGELVCCLGDEVLLQVERHDDDRGRWDFQLTRVTPNES